MGLSGPRLKCDDCGTKYDLGSMPEHQTASGVARDAREKGWEKIAAAWLCRRCVRKYKAAQRSMAMERVGGKP